LAAERPIEKMGADLVGICQGGRMSREPLVTPDTAISAQDWRETPASVKRFVERLSEQLATALDAIEALRQRVTALEAENQALREQLARSSRNSSMPPSSDGPNTPSRPSKPASGRGRGGRKGHRGHARVLIPPEQCQKVIEHRPATCHGCGAALSGEDPAPHRHQVVELPRIEPMVEEHRFHALTCTACGERTRAEWPEDVPHSGYGPRLVATVALLGAPYRLSVRLTQELLAAMFGVTLSTGSVNGARQEASGAVAEPVEQARAFIRAQPVVNVDETLAKQGNADGANPGKRRGWLWTAVTPLVTVFLVSLYRSQETAKQLLGEGFAGILGSDRFSAYAWVEAARRQLCWAHLAQEFCKIAERGGESGRIGEGLLEQERALFALWHRVRDGTLARSSFRKYVGPIRRAVVALLEDGASVEPADGDHSARAKTARTCADLLKLEEAMWTFVRVAGVEPTTNSSERAVRHGVLWRKVSFGTQSGAGSEYVARMLTVLMTLRSQQRNVLEYMTEACRATRAGRSAPTLLPQAVEMSAAAAAGRA
jgi:transposase